MSGPSDSATPAHMSVAQRRLRYGEFRAKLDRVDPRQAGSRGSGEAPRASPARRAISNGPKANARRGGLPRSSAASSNEPGRLRESESSTSSPAIVSTTSAASATLPREHARMIDERRVPQHACARQDAEARLEPDDAAIGSWPNDRAIGLRPERDGNEARRDRRRRSARRAAGRAREIVRIARGPRDEKRILRRDRLADHDRAGRRATF